MAREQQFEFRAFPDEAQGDQQTLIETWRDVAAAKGRAGRLAKRVNGPVDLAYAYEAGEPGQDWSDRYLTTAAPSEYHAAGYRFERLD
jgi:hypothetical protein